MGDRRATLLCRGPIVACCSWLLLAAQAHGDELGSQALRVATRLCEIGPRPSGTHRALQARQELTRLWREAGLDVRLHRFRQVQRGRVQVAGQTHVPPGEAFYLGESGENLYVTVPGQSRNSIVVVAHLDSEASDIPGARDNAAGAGVLVEAAIRAAGKAKTRGPPPRTLVFVLVEGEERGLFGARAFVRDRVAAPVDLGLSLDVLGSLPLGLNGLGPGLGRTIVQAAVSAARDAEAPLSVPIPNLIFSRVIPQGERSDHAAFLDAGIPAFQLYARGPEGFDPCYHSPWDNAERLELPALAASVRFVEAFLERAPQALDRPTHDASFLPLSLSDPLGISSAGPTLVLPGKLARVLLVAFVLLSAVSGVLTVRRWIGRRESAWHKLRSLSLVFAAGALAGAAFTSPFVLAAHMQEATLPWHASYESYCLAGLLSALTLVAILRLIEPLRAWSEGHEIHAVGGMGVGLLGVTALCLAGVPEVGLLPGFLTMGCGLALLRDTPRWQAVTSLPSLAGLACLLRPQLYREGALTWTLPHSAREYVLAAALLGALGAPGVLFVWQTWVRATCRPQRNRSRSAGRRALAIALALSVAAAGSTLHALGQPAYDGNAPALAFLTSSLRPAGGGARLSLMPEQGPHPLLRWQGEPLSPSTVEVGSLPPLLQFRLSQEEDGPRSVLQLQISPREGCPPVERVAVSLFADRAATYLFSDGSQVSLTPGEEFKLEVFGPDLGDPSPLELQQVVLTEGGGKLQVVVYLQSFLPAIEILAPPTMAVRRRCYVTDVLPF